MARMKINPKVLQWRSLAEKWSKQVAYTVPPSFILAIIQMESAGNPKAKRAEPEALARIIRDRKDDKIKGIAWSTGLDTIDIMSSYGLMQLLVTTAWGYLSARHKNSSVIDTLYDPDMNIRYGTSHLSTLLEKRNGEIRLAARDYNGAGAAAEAYGRNAQELTMLYGELLAKGEKV